MGERLRRPGHVKYRREAGYGLVYDHENYGYEDASLYEVNEVVVDVLEYVAEGRSREEVEAEFSPEVVEALLDRGFLTEGA